MLAEAGIQHTILAPWQAEDHPIDTRRPYRVDLGAGRSIVVAFYDGDLSSAVSFAPHATADADRFAQDIVEQRMAADTLPDDEPPLVVIATDGELYGHHQTFRELFLERLVQPRTDGDGPDFDVLPLATALAETENRPFRFVTIAERTSWSCHHGVLRWTAECPCVPDGRWKGPLRSALERLAGGIDAVTVEVGAGFAGLSDVWAARDDYVEVVIGAEDASAFAGRWLGGGGGGRDAGSREAATEATRFLALMEAQRWRLAMFASDGWFWDDPMRPETAAVLRAASHAVRLAAGLAPSAAGLERRLVADLALLRSPGHHLDGAEIYRRALAEVGQPAPDDGPA
jgi:hypothetical protein